MFRYANGKWLNLFEGEAPVASGFGFVRQSGAIKDLILVTNRSAETSDGMRYTFDGKFYRRIECYELSGDTADRRTRGLPCR